MYTMIIIDIEANLPKYQNVIIVDLTTIYGGNIFDKLSPYYPHGGIPIPNTPNLYQSSVNKVWQELCIKKNSNLNKSGYKNIMFRKGLNINEYWSYTEARREIFIPLYCWMLENKAFNIVEYLRKRTLKSTIVIIDKSTNCNIDNIDEPLSCAFLLKAYIEGTEPYQDAIKEVTEKKYIMVGRKEICCERKKIIFQKMACIYTDSQRILDLKCEKLF